MDAPGRRQLSILCFLLSRGKDADGGQLKELEGGGWSRGQAWSSRDTLRCLHGQPVTEERRRGEEVCDEQDQEVRGCVKSEKLVHLDPLAGWFLMRGALFKLFVSNSSKCLPRGAEV